MNIVAISKGRNCQIKFHIRSHFVVLVGSGHFKKISIVGKSGIITHRAETGDVL
jgi:hypothetical protein